MKLTIIVKINSDPAYHPYTATMRSGRELAWESSGESVKALLAQAAEFIIRYNEAGGV